MHNFRKRKTRRYKITIKGTQKVVEDFKEAGDIEAKTHFCRLLKEFPDGTEVLLYAFRKKSPKKRGKWELLLSGGKNTMITHARTVEVQKLCQPDFEYLTKVIEATEYHSPNSDF